MGPGVRGGVVGTISGPGVGLGGVGGRVVGTITGAGIGVEVGGGTVGVGVGEALGARITILIS